MTSVPDGRDPDDTTELPPIAPAFRTPAEWDEIYSRLPRLLAALHSADVAMDTIYLAEPGADATPEANAAFEEEADQVVDQERRARDNIIAWFASWTDKPSAVILPDGRIVCHTLEADGLALVDPRDVHKL